MASQHEDYKGPFDLTADNIRTLQAKAGNYRLGRKLTMRGGLLVDYVGRSDTDITERLTYWLNSDRKYKFFRYKYASSPCAAFYQECHDYHEFNPPDNDIHPDRPDETDWKCPVCSK